jgi:hypothetical protein
MEPICLLFLRSAFQVCGQDVDLVTALDQAAAQILDHARPASAYGRVFVGQNKDFQGASLSFRFQHLETETFENFSPLVG